MAKCLENWSLGAEQGTDQQDLRLAIGSTFAVLHPESS